MFKRLDMYKYRVFSPGIEGFSNAPGLRVSSAGAKEPGVRLFFRPLPIVHLAPNTHMDGCLGFMPPKPYALL
jgi:hypothetical protein